jgi:hypothetical protein
MGGCGAPSIFRVNRPRQQERHLLLTKAAMGPQSMAGELAKIVILAPRAEDGCSIAEDGEIAFAVDGQIELLADL